MLRADGSRRREKALGCFVEIIRYQTRLFVPVPHAAEIMATLAL